jgi:DNA polymerase III alpha subunit
MELVLTGIPFSAHPTEHTTTPVTCHAAEMKYFVNRPVEMVGILDAVKYIQVKPKDGDSREREMSFVTLEDETGTFELVLFPETHHEYARLFASLGPYRVRGTVSEQWDSLSLEVAEVAV